MDWLSSCLSYRKYMRYVPSSGRWLIRRAHKGTKLHGQVEVVRARWRQLKRVCRLSRSNSHWSVNGADAASVGSWLPAASSGWPYLTPMRRSCCRSERPQ
jgi:hypothetical protein